MARDCEDPGHATSRAALRGLELTSEPHLRERADDRLREDVPRRLPGPPLRSIPERRHPRRDGAVEFHFDLTVNSKYNAQNERPNPCESGPFHDARGAPIFWL